MVIEEYCVRVEIVYIVGFYGIEFVNLGVIGVRVFVFVKVY